MTQETPICLVFPHELADGPLNMARDECLLEILSRAEGADAALRTYGWTVPTLSLGYFQGVSDVAHDPRWRGVAMVRRSSGGGAILHHHELTYAIAVSRRHPLSRQAAALYQAVHEVLAELLQNFGVAARRRGEEEQRERTARPFLCFADRDPEDVVVEHVKVIGGAQRRRAGAVLQHGSILLARSTWTPEFPGVADLGQWPPNEPDFRGTVRRLLPESLGFHQVAINWPEASSARAAQLAREVYGSRSWTSRR